MREMEEEFNRAKSKMLGAFEKAISDAAELRKAAAEDAGDIIAPAESKIGEKSGSIGANLADASQAVVETAGKAAVAVDGYVHDDP